MRAALGDECVFTFLPCEQIAAIASRSLVRAKEFAKKHGIPTAYGSYEELAKNPDIGEFGAAGLHRQGK